LITPELFDQGLAVLHDPFGETTPVFRPHLPAEKSQIRELVLEVLGESGFCYDPILNTDLDNIELAYGCSHSRMLVVVHQGKVVGTNGLIDKLDGTVYCRRLTLAKPYRGNGWLYPQLAYVRDYCRRCGFRLVRFDTLERSGMIPSYEKFGYRAIRRDPDGNDVKVTMELALK
jgi:GNAT superfamily N-acetyltransferase